MTAKGELLNELYQARFDGLKELAATYNLPKKGSVEVVRARLIQHLILDEWDLSPEGIKNLMNAEIGEILGIFGIKKSGSVRARRQRLYLHLNQDPKQFVPESLDSMTRDQLHEMCKILELPLSGNKQALLVRVAGVLAYQQGGWGKVKKSLRRPRSGDSVVAIPIPSEDSKNESPETKSVTEQDVVIETVENFVSQHPEGWTFEQETEMRTELAQEGIPISRAPIAASIDDALRAGQGSLDVVDAPAMVQSAHVAEVVEHSLEVEAVLLELTARAAEIEAAGRDYLAVSSTSDTDDLEAFIQSLSSHGFAVEIPAVSDGIRNTMMELEFRSQTEKDAVVAMPNSWREREALRNFENARDMLRDQLNNTLASSEGDLVKARMSFEEIGHGMGLDLRIPSVSGRLHALFDLHVEIHQAEALQDPSIARRNRILRVLQHGAVHLTDIERMTVDRLERNIAGFEELVETVLESSEGSFSDSQQALVIRFLESRGYEVNTVDLRPRVLACAGIIGAELGFISPSEIPRIAPGIMISDTQVDAIVTELKALAQAFKPQGEEEVETDEELVIAESVSDASDRLNSVRGKIDAIDELLARLRG
ncbi:MAG: hypothetical protein HOL22_00830 [Euryarchaeota archaeon]|nr:hypothetical protein [Euryarchaeota archaeon]MBT5595065.1 hypothetical protein [Euryarchaeota archaeon]MBT6640397.1 hypothetical protein [Euryarchaeota archaeon]MBT6845410.1 hypothetical protein [Euryarchaeota archaeon]MBT7063167.1 hypothetical protein [Euryarchaeota archaeon]